MKYNSIFKYNFYCKKGEIKWRVKQYFSTSGLIQSRASDVSNPFDDIMIGIIQLWLKDLEVSHFESWRCERNLKVHGNRRTRPFLFRISLQQFNLGRDLRFFHSAHAFNLPNDGIFRGLVLGLALHADQLNTRGIQRGWDAHFDLLSQKRRFEVGLDHHFDLQLGATNLMNQWNNTEWQRNVLGSSIPLKKVNIFHMPWFWKENYKPHQFIFTIRRNKRNGMLGLKFA